MTGLLIFFGLFILLALWAVGAYNRLISLRNQFKNAFAQIDVQLKRRYDLIPNLIETAKGYMKHERETLEAVVIARGNAQTANAAAVVQPGGEVTMRDLAAAETALSGALSKLFALVEAYPDLKANQNMQQLSEELTSTENKIAFARQAFNDAVMTYNTAAQQFPSNVIASAFSFKHAELLQSTDHPIERQPMRVAF